jgi:enoyl-[acyl-carrier protein] reductase / trans-2-enoyl-CoA reductase (NAD+)
MPTQSGEMELNMIIQSKIKGFICTTAHPEGLKSNVISMIDYVKAQEPVKLPKKILIIGCSTGYGLATRIVSAFGAGSSTLGVALERPADVEKNRTASAGWYNTAAFHKLAHAQGLYAKTIMGDAFSDAIKQSTIEEIKSSFGKVDMVIYSLAAPSRIHPITGIKHGSVIRPIGKTFESKTIDLSNYSVTNTAVTPATDEEIYNTVKVMGGEDWKMWIDKLIEADALADKAITIAYSYIGPEITHPVYRDGTIGRAKVNLEAVAKEMSAYMPSNGKAYVCVNKAVVTQASSAIPVVPLYISILFKVMKQAGLHEGCIEQMYRMAKLLNQDKFTDEFGLIRVDDLEMREDIQKETIDRWKKINNDNFDTLADMEGYHNEFLKLFGFGIDGIDYGKDVEVDISID